MKNILGFFLIVFVACSTGKSSTKPVKNTQQPTRKTSTKMIELIHSVGSGDEGITKGNYVINSKEELAKFLKLTSTSNLITSVDFSKEIVLAVVDKVYNTGGFDIKITNLEDAGNTIQVHIQKTKPRPTDMVTMAITQPFHIVKINKTAKKIAFIYND